MNKFGIRMKEHPVGDVFTWYGMKIEVISTEICVLPIKCINCALRTKCCMRIPCFPMERNDNENIYYKKVE